VDFFFAGLDAGGAGGAPSIGNSVCPETF